MRIEMKDSGPVVPAGELGPLLGLDPVDLRRLMREGSVTAWHEAGTGDDAGRFRLSFRYGGRLLRLTCASDGSVLTRVLVTEKDGSPGPDRDKRPAAPRTEER